MENRQRKQLELAYTYFRMGRFEESEGIYKEIIRENENCLEAYINLANVYNTIKNYDAMYEVAIQAREIFGYDSLINQFFYFYYKNRHDYVRAEEIILEALEKEPMNSSYLIRYAEILVLVGYPNKQKIQELVKDALKYGHDHDVVMHICIYFSLLNMDVLVDINDIIKNYILELPNEFIKYKTLGLRDFLSDRYEEAYANYYEAFSIRPGNKDVLEMLTLSEANKSFYFILKRGINKIGGVHLIYSVTLLTGLTFYIFNHILVFDIFFSLTLFLLLYWLSTYLVIQFKLRKVRRGR